MPRRRRALWQGLNIASSFRCNATAVAPPCSSYCRVAHSSNNLAGTNVWYTDPFRKNASTTPFPGSVRQWIASVNNDRAFDFSGPTIGGERSYGASGTHAPN